MGYLRGERFLCVNALDGHNRHIDYQFRGGWKRQAFEFATYFAAAKLLRIPITAFAPSLDNLVFKKY